MGLVTGILTQLCEVPFGWVDHLTSRRDGVFFASKLGRIIEDFFLVKKCKIRIIEYFFEW